MTAAPNPECAAYPELREPLESQAWWIENGDAFPGRHIHLSTCFPLLERVAGVVHFDVTVHAHNQPGPITSLRIQIFGNGSSSAYTTTKAVSLSCASSDCTWTIPIDVDTRRVAYDGRWEFRFTANVKDTPDPGTDRMYQTTRWHAILANGKPVKNAGESIDRTPGAGGWYQGAEYSNLFPRNAPMMAFLVGPQSGVVALPLKCDKDRLFVTADPAMHASPPNLGVIFFDGPATRSYQTVSVDTTRLTNGRHRLFMGCVDVFSGSNGAGEAWGVQVVSFDVAN